MRQAIVEDLQLLASLADDRGYVAEGKVILLAALDARALRVPRT